MTIEDAIQMGDFHTVQRLVTNMRNINTNGLLGATPLHWACAYEQKEIASFLIQQGADVNASTESGWTPLHTACARQRCDILPLLIQSGADVNATSQFNITPMHLSAEFDQVSRARLLIKAGAHLSSMTVNGDTVIQALISHGSESTLYYLQKIVHRLPETQMNQEDRKRLSTWNFRNHLKNPFK